ncbi:MAG TPA: hypothetical protein VMD76_12000 [Candidatus Sulfotelmatobacter sp.]|nr:hypothetical protein [Candidatus Sulfotelmatobacter sp.]
MSTSDRNSTNRKPMELVDRYLQAVRFWLPRSSRQEDLLAELGEDLRSQIEEKETELGRALDQAEVSAILKKCGAPMVVAGSLGPKRHLIGPAIYPIYIFVLKMVLLWIQLPIFLFIVGPYNVANSAGDWGTALANTIGEIWSGMFIAAGIITIIFAIVERTQAHAAVACKWDPSTLPPLRKTPRKTSMATTVCQLIFGVLGLIWLLVLPQYPVLILGPAAAFLKAAPIWHPFYVPLVALAVLALVRGGITLARPEWEWFPPVGELVQAVCTLILLSFILSAAGQMTGGEWRPFVVAVEANSVQYIKVAAIVNVSILISLICAWVGMGVALLVHLWQLFQYLRNRRTGTGHAEPVQAA